jgi:hypothetical protein
VIRLIRSYIFWTYERGSLHYDVMVTLILLFLFVGPRFIDFRDKPLTNVPIHPNEVLIREAGSNGNVARFVYEIRTEDLDGTSTDAELRASILHVIQPIAGNVQLQSYTPVTDAKGKVVAYDATVLR